MSVATYLASLGLRLERTPKGELVLDNLDVLTLEARGHAISLAKENRLLILAELMRRGGTLSNPYVAHYRAACMDYWRGCLTCKDANPSSLDFCKRHPMPETEEEA